MAEGGKKNDADDEFIYVGPKRSNMSKAENFNFKIEFSYNIINFFRRKQKQI